MTVFQIGVLRPGACDWLSLVIDRRSADRLLYGILGTICAIHELGIERVHRHSHFFKRKEKKRKE